MQNFSLHCKEQTPKIRNKYSKKRNCAATGPISTFMCLWAIYIFPQWICLFGCRKYVDRSWKYINPLQTHECGNWDWGRAIPRKRTHQWDFRCSVVDVRLRLTSSMDMRGKWTCCRSEGRMLARSFGRWATQYTWKVRMHKIYVSKKSHSDLVRNNGTSLFGQKLCVSVFSKAKYQFCFLASLGSAPPLLSPGSYLHLLCLKSLTFVSCPSTLFLNYRTHPLTLVSCSSSLFSSPQSSLNTSCHLPPLLVLFKYKDLCFRRNAEYIVLDVVCFINPSIP